MGVKGFTVSRDIMVNIINTRTRQIRFQASYRSALMPYSALWLILRYFILQILLWNLWKKKIKNTRLCSVRSLWNIAPIYIAYKSGKSCHNYWLYGHHLQHTLINVHITSIQFTTILFIGMQLSRLFPWWVHNLRYDTAFLPFLTRTLNMIFIVQHLTKLQIFTKIGMHSKNSTKASFTTYNSRSVAMKPNP